MNDVKLKQKVYLSGPITGVSDYRDRFGAIAVELERQGYTVLNPAAIPKGLNYGEYFPICLAMLDAAESVLMIPGWHQSRGACLEHMYAKTVGKDIAYYDEQERQPMADLRGLNW